MSQRTFDKRLLLHPYIAPTKNDILVVVSFFSPCNSIRMVQNLLLVKNKFDQANIPYVIIHGLSSDNDSPLFAENSHYITVRYNSVFFMKENLANIAIRQFSATNKEYTKFLVLDSDIVFVDADWYDKVSICLDEYDVIQPFRTAYLLGPDFRRITSTCHSSLSNIPNQIGHPGYGFAFTKAYYEKYGYSDVLMIGGGDNMNCSIIMQTYCDKRSPVMQYFKDVFEKHIAMRQKCETSLIKFGSAKVDVVHLYHNDLRKRQYNTRYKIIEKYIGKGSIYDIIEFCEDGRIEWCESIRENINKDVLAYFTMRDDDGIA